MNFYLSVKFVKLFYTRESRHDARARMCRPPHHGIRYEEWTARLNKVTIFILPRVTWLVTAVLSARMWRLVMLWCWHQTVYPSPRPLITN